MKDPRGLDENMFEPIRRKKNRRERFHTRSRLLCNGKKIYDNKPDAEQTIERLYQFGRATYLRAYRCPLTSHWHLTHKKPR